jgi:soluble lytic murein transglycosylase
MRNSILITGRGLFLLLLIQTVSILNAASFDNSLEKISRLRQQKKYSDLVVLLDKTRASAELEDVRLFLLAESLKSANDKIRAKKVYENLLNRFPERETSFQARLPHFLLALESASPQNLARLEGLARALPTSWQRGTAFEKLSELEFLKPGKKSRFVYMAIQAFHSEKPFYKSIPASHKLIKVALEKSDEFYLEDDEWLRILVLAGQEGLLGSFFNQKKYNRNLLGKWGEATLEIFRAVYLASKGKAADADWLLRKIIEKKNINGLVRAFAYQEKAYLHYQAKKYEEACNDYRKALESSKFPVDSRACQYRLMRSAYFSGRDSECLELLGRMMKTGEPEPLLPAHIYEMGLERFDNGRVQSSVPLFMFLARNFPGHYRADDSIGYSILALGKNSNEAKTLLQLLEKKYPNSFFIYWVAPHLHKTRLKYGKDSSGNLSSSTKNRLKAWRKLWDSPFANFAREEARKMTDKYPLNMALFKEIVKISEEAKDFNQMTAYGERLARQLLEAGKSLADMPLWAWKAHYPLAFMSQVRTQANINKIDPHWVLSIMREESHFKPDTLSRSNAMGLMQILPSTGKWIAQKVGHRRFNKNHLWKPEVNVKFGCWYLKYLSDLFNADLFLASASYNGGQGNIQRKVEKGPYAHLGVLERLDKVPLPETRDYYKKVMGSYWNYGRIYQP